MEYLNKVYRVYVCNEPTKLVVYGWGKNESECQDRAFEQVDAKLTLDTVDKKESISLQECLLPAPKSIWESIVESFTLKQLNSIYKHTPYTFCNKYIDLFQAVSKVTKRKDLRKLADLGIKACQERGMDTK